MSEPEPSTSVSPLSFLSIQRQQLDQDAAPTKTKKSLRETQEEEQARAAAKKAWQQEDFMCWWAAEEDGIHRETGVHLGPPITISASSGSKARKKPREKGISLSRKARAKASYTILTEDNRRKAFEGEDGDEQSETASLALSIFVRFV